MTDRLHGARDTRGEAADGLADLLVARRRRDVVGVDRALDRLSAVAVRLQTHNAPQR